jgi:hypothetical protein
MRKYESNKVGEIGMDYQFGWRCFNALKVKVTHLARTTFRAATAGRAGASNPCSGALSAHLPAVFFEDLQLLRRSISSRIF